MIAFAIFGWRKWWRGFAFAKHGIAVAMFFIAMAGQKVYPALAVKYWVLV